MIIFIPVDQPLLPGRRGATKIIDVSKETCSFLDGVVFGMYGYNYTRADTKVYI